MSEKPCDACGSAWGPWTPGAWSYVESGLPVQLVGVSVRACAACGNREVRIPRPLELHAAIAHAVATRGGRLEATEVRFLRKHLGWSGADFAERMGVSPGTVSRWENGHEQMAVPAERLLRVLALTLPPVRAYPPDKGEIDAVLTSSGSAGRGRPDAFHLLDEHWRAAA